MGQMWTLSYYIKAMPVSLLTCHGLTICPKNLLEALLKTYGLMSLAQKIQRQYILCHMVIRDHYYADLQ